MGKTRALTTILIVFLLLFSGQAATGVTAYSAVTVDHTYRLDPRSSCKRPEHPTPATTCCELPGTRTRRVRANISWLEPIGMTVDGDAIAYGDATGGVTAHGNAAARQPAAAYDVATSNGVTAANGVATVDGSATVNGVATSAGGATSRSATAMGISSEDGDITMDAITDELSRSVEKLKAPGHAAPYFLEYDMYENDDFSVDASLGSVLSKSRRHGRTAFPTLRVGSYKMDNTNFRGSSSLDTPDDAITIEDDYFAIRRALWLLTDSRYKQALETLDEKKAFLLEKSEVEDLDDFSHETPLNWLKPVKKLGIDTEAWTERVRKLSEVFRKHTFLYDSWARFDERILNSWLINSEGTRVRTSECSCRYLLFASIRAKDGMQFSDWEPIISHDRMNLPLIESVQNTAEKMVSRLKDIAEAPLVEDYEGPVLFEDQAAAEFFAQILAPLVTSMRSKINEPLDPFNNNPFSKKLGKRVMPVFMSVTDDPLTKYFNAQELFGTYDVDEQGVRGQKVKLIEDGVLKTLLSGRTPTREVKHSNGHGVAGEGSNTSRCSCLYIDSKMKLRHKELVAHLKKMGKELGLEHVFIVRRLANSSRQSEGDLQSSVSWSGPNSKTLSNPLLIYRVSVKDGKESLVRGARFSSVTSRVLKEIVATGAEVQAYPVETTSNNYFHVITPSIILREIEIERVPPEQVRPPILENPLLEASDPARKFQ